MRHIRDCVVFWATIVMIISCGLAQALYSNNVGAEDDEIMETSGHQDAFQNGQFANVLSGLLSQPSNIRTEEPLTDPDRILCLLNGSKSKGKKPDGQKNQDSNGNGNGEGHQQTDNQQHKNQQQYALPPPPTSYMSLMGQQQNMYGPPQNQGHGYVTGYGQNPPSQNQAYGPQSPVQNHAYGPQSLTQNQAYGPHSPTQNQAYGPQSPTQNQAYGPQPHVQNQAYGPQPPAQNQAYGPQSPTQNQAYGPQPPVQNQAYGPQPPVQNPAYGPQPSVQNQAYGPQPHHVNQRPPKKSYSFSISFGDRLQPRKKPRHHQRPPPMQLRPVPPPLPPPTQQPVYFTQQPQQNFNIQPPQQIINPQSNFQPLPQTNFQSQTNFQPQTNFQQQQQINNQFTLQNNFSPQDQSNNNAQYGAPFQQQQQYFNPLDQVNYQLAHQDPPEPQQFNDNYNPDYQQGQKDLNFVYVYGPPENNYGEEAQNPRPPVRVPQKPETRYQVVVIKAPNPPPHPQVEIELPTPPEQKTLVYVLVKKPNSAPEIKFTKPPTTTPRPPEVFFIKYKNNRDLPSTSDINSDSYNAIKTNVQNQEDFTNEQISEKYVNNQNQGGYQEQFRPSFMLPSTSSAFAMEVGSRPSFSTSSSSSHYSAPGSIPWDRK